MKSFEKKKWLEINNINDELVEKLSNTITVY